MEFDKNGLDSESQAGSDDEPDWMRNFSNKKDDEEEKKIKKEDAVRFGRSGDRSKGSCREFCGGNEKRVGAVNGGKIQSNGSRRKDFENISKRDEVEKMSAVEEDGDDEFLVEDYQSEEDGEASAGSGAIRSKRKGGSLWDSSSSEEEGDRSDSEEEDGLKIYFCSRTHSQLSQFVKELRKTSFAKEIRVICLGSRKNFCINEGSLVKFMLLKDI